MAPPSRQRLPGRIDPRLLRMRAAVQDLSPEARRRLACLLYYLESGSLKDACAHFDIPRQRFYRLLRRFDPADLSTLEDRSGRLSAPTGAVPTRPLVRRPEVQALLLVATLVSVATLAWLLARVSEGRVLPILPSSHQLASRLGATGPHRPQKTLVTRGVGGWCLGRRKTRYNE